MLDQRKSISRDLGGYPLHCHCGLALTFETHAMSLGLCAEFGCCFVYNLSRSFTYRWLH